MFYLEEYCVVNKGIKKDINQDNVYINGICLPEKNDGLNNYSKKLVKLNQTKTYAVFDGVGGLEKGEYASFLAASLLKRTVIKNKIKKILYYINIKLLKIKKQKRIKLGTTASVVQFKKNKIYVNQVGDSPIYILHNDEFIKLVEDDHPSNLLDNYLGSKKKINILENEYTLKANDKIVICSDGLSNAVGDIEIEYILSSSDDVTYITNKLLNYALRNKGADNISIITIIVKKSYKELICVILIALLFCLLLFLMLTT